MLRVDNVPGQTCRSTIWWLAARIKDYPYKPGCGVECPDSPINVSPSFQRGAVWTEEQKVWFVKSLLDGFPMPAIYTNQFLDEEIVIDGKQRLLAVAAFLNDEIKVDGELFSEQDDVFKRQFRMTVAVPHIVCTFKTERECAALYVRLLRTGTAHTEEEIQKAEAILR